MSDPSSDDELAAPEAELPSQGATLEELLDTPVSRPEPQRVSGSPACVIAECTDARHPTLQGRVQVRFSAASGGAEVERWVPTLRGLPVRVADRVLMIRPDNASEWIVTGVIDGFATRPVVGKSEAARVELQRDEAVKVVARDGTQLVEISQGEAGPVVRVLEPDVHVEFAGKLSLSARDIALHATQGEVALEASADVVVKGETIKLN